MFTRSNLPSTTSTMYKDGEGRVEGSWGGKNPSAGQEDKDKEQDEGEKKGGPLKAPVNIPAEIAVSTDDGRSSHSSSSPNIGGNAMNESSKFFVHDVEEHQTGRGLLVHEPHSWASRLSTSSSSSSLSSYWRWKQADRGYRERREAMLSTATFQAWLVGSRDRQDFAVNDRGVVPLASP